MVDKLADAAQADAVMAGMHALPTTAGELARDLVLTNLVDHCDDSDPVDLQHRAEDLAQRLTVVSQDGPPPDEDAEQTAHERRHVTVRRAHGGVEGDFFAPDEHDRARAAPTSKDNGALLCPHHQRTGHGHGWTGRGAHSRPEYQPPPWIDPHQKPPQPIRYGTEHVFLT